MTNQTDEILINVEESQNSRSFIKKSQKVEDKESKILFEEEFKVATKLISNIVDKVKKNSCEQEENEIQEDYFHQHNTIAILGPRGVGKTSFLLSLPDYINKKNKCLRKKIEWLPILDPTRLEQNEAFLVIVVANILKQIKEGQNRGGLSQQIRGKLEILSRDFTVLAPRQVQEEKWKDLLGDPTSFAYELLNQAHSGISLAHSFHDFLGECLTETHKKVFVQPIDDVDSAIDQGWPILETLRRYLATPYLITILSGDISLYQALVRKRQTENLKSLIELRKIIENEPTIRSQTIKIIDQVTRLTDQYLVKVIPPHLRVRLTPLSVQIMNAAERGEELIKLKYDSFPEKVFEGFSEVYAKFSQDLFNMPEPKNESNSIEVLQRRSWLPLPLLPSATRSMVKLIKVIQPWAKETETKKTDKEAAINAGKEGEVKLDNAP